MLKIMRGLPLDITWLETTNQDCARKKRCSSLSGGTSIWKGRGCSSEILACSAGVFIGRARMVLIAKAPCWNSRREEEMGRSHLPSGLILLLSPIFLCHRIKDGGFIVAIRLTSFRPPKIRLHCRLRKFWIKPLKETNLGVAQPFFDP